MIRSLQCLTAAAVSKVDFLYPVAVPSFSWRIGFLIQFLAAIEARRPSIRGVSKGFIETIERSFAASDERFL